MPLKMGSRSDAGFMKTGKEIKSMSQPLVKVENLKKHFPIKGGLLGKNVGEVKAVDGVSFYIKKGETLGLVGESGCGKTTTGRAILQLYKPTEGEVNFWDDEANDYIDLVKLSGERMRKMRRKMQIIFQDPYGSLNPRMSCGSIIGE